MSNLNTHPHQLPSPAPSPYPADHADPDAVRAELEAQLLRLSQDLYEMEVCAGEVGAGMEDAVPNYLAKINTAFIALSNLAPQVTDSVPRNVVDHVDRYKNPHQYTKTTLSRATGENQYALGRQLGLESFRRQLHDAISESFPGVPLPERRHKPLGEVKEEGEGASGAAAAGDRGHAGAIAEANETEEADGAMETDEVVKTEAGTEAVETRAPGEAGTVEITMTEVPAEDAVRVVAEVPAGTGEDATAQSGVPEERPEIPGETAADGVVPNTSAGASGNGTGTVTMSGDGANGADGVGAAAEAAQNDSGDGTEGAAGATANGQVNGQVKSEQL